MTSLVAEHVLKAGSGAPHDGLLSLLAAIAFAAMSAAWVLWARYGLLGSAMNGRRSRAETGAPSATRFADTN